MPLGYRYCQASNTPLSVACSRTRGMVGRFPCKKDSRNETDYCQDDAKSSNDYRGIAWWNGAGLLSLISSEKFLLERRSIYCLEPQGDQTETHTQWLQKAAARSHLGSRDAHG
ncbi:hypothetical protein P154DRAFT_255017 [Amniculicola lignicola CBS 123094]|uniref:Uncharacterized protein n=1 Tax=Amniculicola lignicola CBS 123094 TaxID=1392246 RepID=A0A6A5WX89_9PLEO|nr:hypothetical protein P154DRAFT_255017 [Amniculicola lignicola CBS 123094]